MITLLFSALLSMSAFAATCVDGLSLNEAMIATAVGPGRLEQAQEKALRALAWFTVWQGRPWRQVCGDRVDVITTLYSGILGMRARGLNNHAEADVKTLIAQLRLIVGEAFDEAIFRRELGALSVDPEIDRIFGFAAPITKGHLLPEQLFGAYRDELLNVDRLAVTGPHQAEIIRLIHQFGHVELGERTLYVGQGAPAVLTGSAYYSGPIKFEGLDWDIPAARTNKFLTRISASISPIVEGQTAFAGVRGPYQVISAVDVITTHPERRNLVSGSGLAVTTELASLLSESGVLIILNDFGQQPPFSPDDAIAAGFKILRWNIDRHVPAELVPLIYPDGLWRPGDLRTFVLRRGRERLPSNLRMIENKLKD